MQNLPKKKKYRTSNALSLKLNGNVAFNRDINPNDFWKALFTIHFQNFFGGVAKKNTIEEAKKLMEINQKIALKMMIRVNILKIYSKKELNTLNFQISIT